MPRERAGYGQTRRVCAQNHGRGKLRTALASAEPGGEGREKSPTRRLAGRGLQQTGALGRPQLLPTGGGQGLLKSQFSQTEFRLEHRRHEGLFHTLDTGMNRVRSDKADFSRKRGLS